MRDEFVEALIRERAPIHLAQELPLIVPPSLLDAAIRAGFNAVVSEEMPTGETVYDSIDDAIEGLNRGLVEMEAMKRGGGT